MVSFTRSVSHCSTKALVAGLSGDFLTVTVLTLLHPSQHGQCQGRHASFHHWLLRAAAWRLRAITVASAVSPSLTAQHCSSSFSSSTSELVTGLSTCPTASSRINGIHCLRTCIRILPRSIHASL
ncbi:hypothetical protein E2C01_049259 [Portunus trituberculatus]|uniref:Uncharacterized protein n=1 Tax=Portunus trituberculatus TaxID=210409 RepID=A0A5B7GDE0_PORTR|nr:hypothetical protein [Portunus trituberculatus]